MISESTSDEDDLQPLVAGFDDNETVDESSLRKPYQKPTLEKHSDPNLWAFGSM